MSTTGGKQAQPTDGFLSRLGGVHPVFAYCHPIHHHLLAYRICGPISFFMFCFSLQLGTTPSVKKTLGCTAAVQAVHARARTTRGGPVVPTHAHTNMMKMPTALRAAYWASNVRMEFIFESEW